MTNTGLYPEDDLQLAVFLDKRDQQSMDYFFDKYSSALYGTIYRMTNKKDLAEECLTKTFVTAWNEIETFSEAGSSLFTWLLNIARQSAYEANAQNREKNQGADNYVDWHDQKYSAFELVYNKGFSVTQAAELCGITVLELKNNLRRDLQNIQSKKPKT